MTQCLFFFFKLLVYIHVPPAKYRNILIRTVIFAYHSFAEKLEINEEKSNLMRKLSNPHFVDQSGHTSDLK